jgi:hypothetical protein
MPTPRISKDRELIHDPFQSVPCFERVKSDCDPL